MQENMHQQIYLPLFAASPLWLRSESNLFTRPFHNVPLNYFTNQGHGTGYCLEDKGINDIIITRDIEKKRKKKKRHSVICNQDVFLCAERAPEIRSNLPLCHAATPTESNFTDASTQHLTFSRCFYFGPLSICTSESGQMAGLLSDKNLRDTSTVTPRDSLAADARLSRGWNELITPHTTLGLPSSLSSPPVRRAA